MSDNDTENSAVRVCMRVADGPAHGDSTRETCVTCGEEVWVARFQMVPVPDGTPVHTMCSWCAVLDDKLGPEVSRAFRDLQRAARFADGK